ncbi:MAG: hypothetical protein WAU45_14435 [Blastocatellia bacterium]
MDRETNQNCPPSSNQDNISIPEALAIDHRLNETRSRISDLGHEIDARKATVARSMGGAVFLLMLSAGAAYDLVTHNAALSIVLGVTRETLLRIALGCGLAGLALLAHAIVRSRFSDQSHDAELAELEHAYADLLDLKDSTSQPDS